MKVDLRFLDLISKKKWVSYCLYKIGNYIDLQDKKVQIIYKRTKSINWVIKKNWKFLTFSREHFEIKTNNVIIGKISNKNSLVSRWKLIQQYIGCDIIA